jgi:uncharacterized protein with ATP-grasp and redox domains
MRLKPPQPLPAPLKGNEIPSFANYTIQVRLIEIARRTLNENRFSAAVVAKLETLIGEIPYSLIRPLQIPMAPDARLWEEYTHPYLGQNWLDVPWFFAEEYFYYRILEATGYFHEGSGSQQDPYVYQKQLGLDTTLIEIRLLASQLEEMYAASPEQTGAMIERMLLINLWGNQNDLSFFPAVDSVQDADLTELREAKDHLIVDDTAPTVQALMTIKAMGRKTRIDYIVDNAGYELITDLAVADFLLEKQITSTIIMHVKPQPVFVSDAMVKDVLHTIEFLGSDTSIQVRSFASRLYSHLETGKITLSDHSYWTSPLPMWEMPPDLYGSLSESDMLIVKGDANYRRLLGDLHWPVEMPFVDVLRYMPAPVLALRTLKSEIAVGIDLEDAAVHLPAKESNWMTSGRWGTIQYAQETRHIGQTQV